MEETMKKEEFSEWVGAVLDANLGYRKMLDSTTKQYLEQMNLPSREDLSSLSALIVNLDSKVDNLEEQMEESLENQTPQAVVKREITNLKKEVKEMGAKLDEVIQLMKEIKK